MTDKGAGASPANPSGGTGHVDEPESGAGYGGHAEEPAKDKKPLDTGLEGGTDAGPGSDQR